MIGNRRKLDRIGGRDHSRSLESANVCTCVRGGEKSKGYSFLLFFSFPFLSHSRETRWCGTSLRGRARLRNGEIERHVRGARVSNTWRVTLGSETGAREYSYRCYNRVDNVPFRRPSFFPPPPSLSSLMEFPVPWRRFFARFTAL